MSAYLLHLDLVFRALQDTHRVCCNRSCDLKPAIPGYMLLDPELILDFDPVLCMSESGITQWAGKKYDTESAQAHSTHLACW